MVDRRSLWPMVLGGLAVVIIVALIITALLSPEIEEEPEWEMSTEVEEFGQFVQQVTAPDRAQIAEGLQLWRLSLEAVIRRSDIGMPLEEDMEEWEALYPTWPLDRAHADHMAEIQEIAERLREEPDERELQDAMIHAFNSAHGIMNYLQTVRYPDLGFEVAQVEATIEFLNPEIPLAQQGEAIGRVFTQAFAALRNMDRHEALGTAEPADEPAPAPPPVDVEAED